MSVAAPPMKSAESEAAPQPAAFQWDWWLLGTAGVLMGFGLLMIVSTSSVFADQIYGDALHFVTRQVVGLGLGLVLATAVVFLPWKRLRQLAWPSYLLGLAGLLAVMIPGIGYTANHATRWISLGGINFQPSEFAKVALVMLLADYLARNEGRLKDVVGVVLPALGLAAPVLILVMLEPDFGTTVLLVGLVGVLLFVAGLRWRWVAGMGAVALGALGLLAVTAPYRLERLTSFLDPFADPAGSGYQVVQGWIALASGGIFGNGLATGLAQQGFLPEAHTDFIAAVVAEELGAIGFVGMILAYGLLVWRGSVVASRATDLFGMLVAAAITALLGAQSVINLGVVVGLMPAKGLVLPFLSYGSSAAVVHTLCIGILLRISMETRAFEGREEV